MADWGEAAEASQPRKKGDRTVMRSVYLKLAVVTIALCLVSSGANATPWTGTLTWDLTEAQLVAADHDVNAWAGTGTSIEWAVNYDDTRQLTPWRYQYTVSVDAPGSLSHLIIETSLTFTEDDIADWDHAWELGTWDNQGKSNPSIPDSLYGLKFQTDLDDDLKETFSFYSSRDPVWGDFYARNGKLDTFVWNTGFQSGDDLDPDDKVVSLVSDSDSSQWPDGYYPYDTGNVLWTHIAVPDTTTSSPNETPEPCTWVLLAATGVIGGIVRRRRD